MGLPMKVVALDANGGYDTHDNQAASLNGDLAMFSQSLAAFQADLEARGLADRVLINVWSEFGRRPEENGSGTDHGAAGLSMVIGTQARGQMVGEFPGLGDARRGRQPPPHHRLPRRLLLAARAVARRRRRRDHPRAVLVRAPSRWCDEARAVLLVALLALGARPAGRPRGEVAAGREESATPRRRGRRRRSEPAPWPPLTASRARQAAPRGQSQGAQALRAPAPACDEAAGARGGGSGLARGAAPSARQPRRRPPTPAPRPTIPAPCCPTSRGRRPLAAGPVRRVLLRLSRSSVLAGDVRVEFDNSRGEDPHDLKLMDAAGDVLGFDEQPSGAVDRQDVPARQRQLDALLRPARTTRRAG